MILLALRSRAFHPLKARPRGTISLAGALTEHRATKPTMLASVIILALISLLVATEPES